MARVKVGVTAHARHKKNFKKWRRDTEVPAMPNSKKRMNW